MFECKLTLRKGDVPKVFSNAAQIKRLLEPVSETPFDDLHHQPIVGLLAHACALGRDPMGVLFDLIGENEGAFAKHPRELLDIICRSRREEYAG